MRSILIMKLLKKKIFSGIDINELNKLRKEAIEHALMAEDFKRAARLVEELSEIIWQRGEPIRLFQWIKALPDEYLISKPNLCIFCAWDLVDKGQHQSAERSLQLAERAVDSINNEKTVTPKDESKKQHSLTKRELQGRIAAIRASMATGWGDIQNIVKFSDVIFVVSIVHADRFCR